MPRQAQHHRPGSRRAAVTAAAMLASGFISALWTKKRDSSALAPVIVQAPTYTSSVTVFKYITTTPTPTSELQDTASYYGTSADEAAEMSLVNEWLASIWQTLTTWVLGESWTPDAYTTLWIHLAVLFISIFARERARRHVFNLARRCLPGYLFVIFQLSWDAWADVTSQLHLLAPALEACGLDISFFPGWSFALEIVVAILIGTYEAFTSRMLEIYGGRREIRRTGDGGEVDRLRREITELETVHARKKRNLATTQADMEAAITNAQSSVSTATSKVAAADADLIKKEADLQSYNREIKTTMDTLSKLHAHVDKREHDLSMVDHWVDAREQDLQDITTKISSAKDQLHHIQHKANPKAEKLQEDFNAYKRNTEDIHENLKSELLDSRTENGRIKEESKAALQAVKDELNQIQQKPHPKDDKLQAEFDAYKLQAEETHEKLKSELLESQAQNSRIKEDSKAALPAKQPEPSPSPAYPEANKIPEEFAVFKRNAEETLTKLQSELSETRTSYDGIKQEAETHIQALRSEEAEYKSQATRHYNESQAALLSTQADLHKAKEEIASRQALLDGVLEVTTGVRKQAQSKYDEAVLTANRVITLKAGQAAREEGLKKGQGEMGSMKQQLQWEKWEKKNLNERISGLEKEIAALKRQNSSPVDKAETLPAQAGGAGAQRHRLQVQRDERSASTGRLVAGDAATSSVPTNLRSLARGQEVEMSDSSAMPTAPTAAPSLPGLFLGPASQSSSRIAEPDMRTANNVGPGRGQSEVPVVAEPHGDELMGLVGDGDSSSELSELSSTDLYHGAGTGAVAGGAAAASSGQELAPGLQQAPMSIGQAVTGAAVPQTGRRVCWVTPTQPCTADPCLGDPDNYDDNHNIIYDWRAPSDLYGPYGGRNAGNESARIHRARAAGFCHECFCQKYPVMKPMKANFGPRKPVYE